MPTSWYNVIPEILSLIEKHKPRSILDIGIGFGKYGVLIREVLELPYERYDKLKWQHRVEGVEVFEGYKNPLHTYAYDKVYYSNILDVIDKLPQYDVILLIDVLEHFTKEEGYLLLNKLLEHTKNFILISTPLYPDIQKDYEGNPHEEHKSRWSIIDFVDYDYSFKLIPIGNNGAQLFTIFPTTQDVKEKINTHLYTQIIENNSLNAKPKLKIGYLLPHKNLTGGLKMILENMRYMKKKGHTIFGFLKSDTNDDVIPNWYRDIEIDEKIILPHKYSFSYYIEDCDIVIAGWLGQLIELKRSKIPVIYWEQGSEWLFGDYRDLSPNSKIREHLKECFSSDAAFVSASPLIAKVLKVRYGKDSTIIPNGIDTTFYFPRKKEKSSQDISILLVGHPYLWFKGFEVALIALEMVWRKGYRFNVNWVCQELPNVKNLSYPINFIKKPSQEELAEIYRNSDMLVFTSWYEGFGMPPLEAMASGIPVVSTKCGGVESFITPGVNGILVETGDVEGIAYAVMELIKNRKLREILANRGRQTALNFDFEKITEMWEALLYKVKGDA